MRRCLKQDALSPVIYIKDTDRSWLTRYGRLPLPGVPTNAIGCRAVCCGDAGASAGVGSRHCCYPRYRQDEERRATLQCSAAAMWEHWPPLNLLQGAVRSDGRTDGWMLTETDPPPPVVEHEQAMLQPPYCVGWEEIKAFQMRGHTFQHNSRTLWQNKKPPGFPSSQIKTLCIALSLCSSLTVAFLPAGEISDFFCVLRLWLRKVWVCLFTALMAGIGQPRFALSRAFCWIRITELWRDSW